MEGPLRAGQTRREFQRSPSKTPKANTPGRPPRGRREASVGRAGGGRPLHPEPDQIIVATAKSCPHCGHGVQDTAQQLHSVYDEIAFPPPVKPLVTRVEQYVGRSSANGAGLCGPCPGGDGTGTPLGPPSVKSRDLPCVIPMRSVTSDWRGSWGRSSASLSVKGPWRTCSMGSKAACPTGWRNLLTPAEEPPAVQ